MPARDAAQPGWVEVVAPRHERPAADAGADAVDGLRRLRRGKQIVSHAPSTGRSCRTTTGGLRCRGRRSRVRRSPRSEEHTSELQSLMRISYAVFCLKKKK